MRRLGCIFKPDGKTVVVAMEAGACGVAIGRNAWKSPDPAAVTRALAALVHNGKKASQINL